MNNAAPPFPLAYPHDPVTEISDDVFMVRGSIRMNALMRITRNMAIVRYNDTLTLINPIRLSDEGEKSLTSLGKVGQIIRLGAFHGLDDPYYVSKFGADFWCQVGGKAYQQPAIDVPLTAGCALPFPDGQLVTIEGAKQPEAVMLIQRGPGLLLTCDAIQHYGDYRHNNLPARLVMPFIGFPKTTIVGPIWLKYMTPKDTSLQPAFEQLLELEFDSLLSAHGSFLKRGAKSGVRAAIERAFPANSD